MAQAAPGRGEGFFSALREVGASLSAIAATRLELASTELSLARIQFVRVLVVALVAAMFGFVALVAASLLVAVIFWETHRVEAMVALVVVYTLAALLLTLRLKRELRESPPLLAATLTELRLDAQAMRGLRTPPQEPAP
jgi:uncharacterized membrane protein YqjE